MGRTRRLVPQVWRGRWAPRPGSPGGWGEGSAAGGGGGGGGAGDAWAAGSTPSERSESREPTKADGRRPFPGFPRRFERGGMGGRKGRPPSARYVGRGTDGTRGGLTARSSVRPRARTHANAFAAACAHIRMRARTRTNFRAHARAHTHTNTKIHTHARGPSDTFADKAQCTRARIHTRTHSRTHTLLIPHTRTAAPDTPFLSAAAPRPRNRAVRAGRPGQGQQ